MPESSFSSSSSSSSYPREVRIEDIDGVGVGGSAVAALVKNTKFIIKVHDVESLDHRPRELEVYRHMHRHPNVLRFYDEAKVIREDNSFLSGIVLEYHQRGTLYATIVEKPAFARAHRDRWRLDATHALRHVHSQGVIHGDAGSHNFLVKDDGGLVLADFGGSKVLGRHDHCLEPAGSRNSRPFVVTASRPPPDPMEIDDIFALGTVLYEISTTSCPIFPDMNNGEIATCFREKRYPSMEGVPEMVQRVIRRCWGEKYASVDEVLRDMTDDGHHHAAGTKSSSSSKPTHS